MDSSISCEDLERVTIGDDEDQYFQVGSLLPTEDKVQLVEFLKDNLNVFVWSVYEAPKVDPKFICHHLNINRSVTPKRQIPRWSSKEHAEVVKDEVCKLK